MGNHHGERLGLYRDAHGHCVEVGTRVIGLPFGGGWVWPNFLPDVFGAFPVMRVIPALGMVLNASVDVNPVGPNLVIFAQRGLTVFPAALNFHTFPHRYAAVRHVSSLGEVSTTVKKALGYGRASPSGPLFTRVQQEVGCGGWI